MPDVVIAEKQLNQVYRASGNGELLQTVGAPLYLEHIVFDGCTIDGGLAASIAVSLNGTHFKSCTFINCQFSNVLQGVVAIHARNLRFANCEFTNHGNVHVGTYIKLMYCGDVLIENCRFLPSNSAIELIHCDNVTLRCNTFLGMWRHVPAYPTYDSRSSGVFSSEALVDNAIDLSHVPQYATIRATERITKGKAAYITPYMITLPKSNDDIQVGDVIVIDDCFTVVTRIAQNDLFINGWWDTRTLDTVFPSSQEYQVNRNYYGHAGYISKNRIELFFGAWLDINGNAVTPPQKCKYSVLPHANYNGVNTSGVCTNIVIDGNRFLGGWADQISLGMRSKDCTVTNNYVEDGQDTGITVNGSGHTISNNRVLRQGCNGIWLNAQDCNVNNNVVRGWRYARGQIGNSYPEYNGILLADCTSCSVTHNAVHGTALTKNCIVLTDCISVALSGNATDTSGVAICGSKTQDCHIRHDGDVTYPSGYFGLGVAPGQHSEVCGDAMPESTIKAGPGSIYRQTLGPVYTKDEGFDNIGWHRI